MFLAHGHVGYSREQIDRDPTLRDLLFSRRRQSIKKYYHAFEAKCYGNNSEQGEGIQDYR